MLQTGQTFENGIYLALAVIDLDMDFFFFFSPKWMHDASINGGQNTKIKRKCLDSRVS